MSEKLEAYYGLPQEVVYCTRCTISNQKPNSVVEFKSKITDPKATIFFDEQGVCSACRYAELKEAKIDWNLREKELKELCDKHRRNDGTYDCIIPGSGGKDSAFAAHVMKYKYGMNPLTVTWAPHLYTDIGWENFQSWIHSGLDNYLYTPNGSLHRKLTRMAFENLCHPFQPFIIGQKQVGPRFSALYKVPLIIYGENPAEYGNNIKDNDRPTMEPSFYSERPDLKKLFLSGISAEELIAKHSVDKRDLNPYLPVDGEILQKQNTEVHYLGYYLKWDPQECYYYAAEHTGFKTNTERTQGSYSKYSSIDDMMDVLHFYTTFIKFGIGRATYDTAQEIRNKKITREEGIALVHRYDNEFPSKYFKDILEYMEISEQRFFEVIDKARSPHLWKKVGNEWALRHQIK